MAKKYHYSCPSFPVCGSVPEGCKHSRHYIDMEDEIPGHSSPDDGETDDE